VRGGTTVFGWDENNISPLKHIALFCTWSTDGMSELLSEDQTQEFDICLNI